MWYTCQMNVQRTITILLPNDDDLRQTLVAFCAVRQAVSATCFNDGAPVNAIQLQRAVYHAVKGTLNSQMTITALRSVAGAYLGAKRNKRPATKPFGFQRRLAVFLIGRRGRDADFRADGTLSIWTVGGRKRLSYTVPPDFRATLNAATEIDSLTVIERDGRLIGRVVVTLTVPDPAGVVPVGVDLNETNAVVAVDADGRELFISGLRQKVANTRTRKTFARIQRKRATRKADGRDTRSVRRVLKRLGRKRRNRTRTFCQTAAKRLVAWSPDDAVVVLEALALPQQDKRRRQRPGVRRRLAIFPYALLRECIERKSQERGVLVVAVDPAYTSQDCARCGLRGVRRKHRFTCPHCRHEAHADLNAARNIRDRYTVLRGGGPSSTGLEVQASAMGKLPVSTGSS